MKKYIFLNLLVAMAVIIGSCNKNEIEPQNKNKAVAPDYALTPQQEHFKDSVLAGFSTQKPVVTNLKAGLAVTVTATKISCNIFRLKVTVNQQFCPRTDSPLVAYWTLFDSFGRINLAPTYGKPCITGNQIRAMVYLFPIR